MHTDVVADARLLELFETLQDQVLQLLPVPQCSGITFQLFVCVQFANIWPTGDGEVLLMMKDVYAYRSHTHTQYPVILQTLYRSTC